VITAARAYTMLGNETLWNVALDCQRALQQANIPHSICGGVAVCLHGYQRNTTDIDIIILDKDVPTIKDLLTAQSFHWDQEAREFRSPTGIPVQFLIAGERAGKDSEVKIAEPIGEENIETREGLSVVRLSRLIEMKLACGLGSMRRTHKDFADVVELIAIRRLDGSFARYLHPSVRPTFRELVRCAGSSD
jgi:hypothetical protein